MIRWNLARIAREYNTTSCGCSPCGGGISIFPSSLPFSLLNNYLSHHSRIPSQRAAPMYGGGCAKTAGSPSSWWWFFLFVFF